MAQYSGYASGGTKRPLTKRELKEKQKRNAGKSRRRTLVERHDAAVSNVRELRGVRSGAIDAPEYEGQATPAIDNRFMSDIQNAKFCRKPVGFLMSLIFLIAIALIAMPFVPLDIPMVSQYTALFQEAEPQAEEPAEGDEENATGDEETTPDEAAAVLAAERAANADETDEATGDDADADAEAEEGDGEEDAATYYSMKDPLFGWISYIAGLVGMDLRLGDSPWYDAQIAKVQTGMEDTIAPYLIQAFPPAIVLYAIFALALFIKTFVCWASGDRRIYRNTWVECLVMIVLALIVAVGGYACTVDITGAMDFGGIVDYLIGAVTGAGGFTAGFGLLIMVGLPLIGLILSFFLLTRKLRSRDVMQPVIMYNYSQGRH